MSTRCVAFAPRSVKLRGCLSGFVRHSFLTRTCRQPPTAANPARRVTTAAMSQGGANNRTAGGSSQRSSGGEPCFQRDDATGTFRLTMAVGAGSRAAVRSTNFHSTLSLAVTTACCVHRSLAHVVTAAACSHHPRSSDACTVSSFAHPATLKTHPYTDATLRPSSIRPVACDTHAYTNVTPHHLTTGSLRHTCMRQRHTRIT